VEGRAVKRVLFLADRNILVDQTMNNDFKPFGGDMTKVQNRTDRQVLRGLPRALPGGHGHRGGEERLQAVLARLLRPRGHRRVPPRQRPRRQRVARDPRLVRAAIQLGLTATPKETDDGLDAHLLRRAGLHLLLKQGIDDGFLAPYKVVRVDLDRDLQGWRPPKGMKDDRGQLIEDRIYNQRDMDRALVLNQRTKPGGPRGRRVPARHRPYGKTIVFCEDIDHASACARRW
jgi:type I restriction enzyme R subunit